MSLNIALVGNPNSGKTTLFNSLTGSNQTVGNWPGVTVEKKAGKYKKDKTVNIIDLPGIYSLSPYTLEEVVARNYLLDEKPDVILNIIDGTNIERNLFLTTQIKELNIPMVVLINMMDVVEKNGDKIDIIELKNKLGLEIVEISALKQKGIFEACDKAISIVKNNDLDSLNYSVNKFTSNIEKSIEEIENVLTNNDNSFNRFYAIKLFERDEKIATRLNLSKNSLEEIEKVIKKCEELEDDDSESSITNERYNFISEITSKCIKKANKSTLTTTDKIDKVVTNRFLALPIFIAIMFFVYYVSVTTVGTWATDFANDGLFGEGFYLFGNGSDEYQEALEKYDVDVKITEAFLEDGSENLEKHTAVADIYDADGEFVEQIPVDYNTYLEASEAIEPEKSDYGTWVSGIPVLVENFLIKINCADWLQGLILDGILAGVFAVLGFVPQMLILFMFLAFLESCGYMARVAFIMDRVFRKFGLSGKSFIPILIGSGCGVPGIMASRTIENEKDRRMTIITTTFIPCGAKLPIIALIAGAMFSGAWWVAPSAYFIGIFSIILSGVILKKTKLFEGEVAPFVMELPQYRIPTANNILRTMFDRAISFVQKAFTIILLASVVIWVLSNVGFSNGKFSMTDMNDSLLAFLGNLFAPMFIPLGFGTWQASVATITGLIAKENVVGTFGVLFGNTEEVSANGVQIWANMQQAFTPLSAFSFLVFNLLCAPCFAAMGAIKREMQSAKWTAFAITYQCVFAYMMSFIIYQMGMFYIYGTVSFLTIIAVIIIITLIFMLFKKPNKTN